MNAEQYLESKRVRELKKYLYIKHSIYAVSLVGIIIICGIYEFNMVQWAVGVAFGWFLNEIVQIKETIYKMEFKEDK